MCKVKREQKCFILLVTTSNDRYSVRHCVSFTDKCVPVLLLYGFEFDACPFNVLITTVA